jgi:predicted AlkP superfamily pyrophosphatase or phosphodiesterase
MQLKSLHTSIFLILFGCLSPLLSQVDAPKLVVVLSVDQMRAEYLDRYDNKFGQNGFKKLIGEGYQFKNGHFNYMPTETGPGHAAIYTGATPAISGVIGNGWYDRSKKKSVNVVSENDKYQTIGAPDSIATGRAGPDHLLVTTIADELKLASQFRSKTVSVSIKDRSAILGGGHTSDGSYWYDGLTGKFITSSYYMDALPAWVDSFNNNGMVDSISKLTWDLSFPLSEYTASRSDDSRYEYKFRGKKTPTFPYNFSEMNAGFDSYFLIPYTPFSNDLLVSFAEEAIINEQLGQDDDTDFLAIGFSSTDYSGHAFGPYSVEIEDLYIKLDRTIENLINLLDQTVGKNEYILVLSSDHGAVPAPRYLRSLKLPGGINNPNALAFLTNTHIKKVFDIDTIILYNNNMSFYLDYDKLEGEDQFNEVSKEIKRLLEKDQTILSVHTRESIQSISSEGSGPDQLLKNGYFPERSGDIFFISRPGWFGITTRIATSHGTPFSYDTHVPIIFYGKGIPQGSTVRKVNVTEIAPSISFLCGVMIPNGSTGEVLIELFK